MKDKIVEKVRQDLLDRSERGIKKYGTTLDQNTKDNFLQHLYEELLDAALYAKRLIWQQEQRQLLKEITEADEADGLYECEEDYTYVGQLLGKGIYDHAKEKED